MRPVCGRGSGRGSSVIREPGPSRHRRCRRRRRRRRRATGIISIDNNTVDTVEIALC